MAARSKEASFEADLGSQFRNEVHLVGTMPVDSEERTLPSGDVLRSFRVAITRPPRRGVERKAVDSLECVAWDGRVRRSVASWRPGDVVEVSGSLRRRFFRTGAGTGSRVEVEVTQGRLVRRAAT